MKVQLANGVNFIPIDTLILIWISRHGTSSILFRETTFLKSEKFKRTEWKDTAPLLRLEPWRKLFMSELTISSTTANTIIITAEIQNIWCMMRKFFVSLGIKSLFEDAKISLNKNIIMFAILSNQQAETIITNNYPKEMRL